MSRLAIALLALLPSACATCSISSCNECSDITNVPAEEPCIYSEIYSACTTPDEGHYCSCSKDSYVGPVTASEGCSITCRHLRRHLCRHLRRSQTHRPLLAQAGRRLHRRVPGTTIVAAAAQSAAVPTHPPALPPSPSLPPTTPPSPLGPPPRPCRRSRPASRRPHPLRRRSAPNTVIAHDASCAAGRGHNGLFGSGRGACQRLLGHCLRRLLRSLTRRWCAAS